MNRRRKTKCKLYIKCRQNILKILVTKYNDNVSDDMVNIDLII